MKSGALAIVAVLGCATPAAQHPGAPPPPRPVPPEVAAKVKLELVTDDSNEPVAIVAPPGEPVGRLFVVEKRGVVRILRGRTFAKTSFLDLSARVSLERKPNGERGLLGLAFHPQYATNRRFYVNFTDKDGDTRVLELRADKDDPERADPTSERQILFVDQPYANHNAGDLMFGRDGKLYVALGDGGNAGDPQGHGQNPKSLLSKLIRFDVEAAAPLPEVIGKGLRNPWRTSFDRATGDLYLADVGQNAFEYVHVVAANDLVGHNFGWNITEGFHCYKRGSCDVKGLTAPAVEYPHKEGCSVTGGYVYRGKALPELNGLYFYADYCTALVRSFRWQNGKAVDGWDWRAALDPESQLARLSTFGQDQDGELYLVSHDGPIYKFVRR